MNWGNHAGQLLPAFFIPQNLCRPVYDWSLAPRGEVDEEGQRWMLFRRSISDPKDLAYYVVSAPKKTSQVRKHWTVAHAIFLFN